MGQARRKPVLSPGTLGHTYMGETWHDQAIGAERVVVEHLGMVYMLFAVQ